MVFGSSEAILHILQTLVVSVLCSIKGHWAPRVIPLYHTHNRAVSHSWYCTPSLFRFIKMHNFTACTNPHTCRSKVQPDGQTQSRCTGDDAPQTWSPFVYRSGPGCVFSKASLFWIFIGDMEKQPTRFVHHM